MSSLPNEAHESPSLAPEGASEDVVRTPEQDAAIRAAGIWVHQLARTIKTCRLYDAENPAVVRFRNELVASAVRTLEQHGPLRLKFTAEDVLCEDVSLYPARSRDDNLALPFYRDGIRFLTLTPGILPREVDALVDAILRVTGQANADDDLVTVLWESALSHVDVEYVPAQGDIGGGGAQTPGPDEETALLPWPAAPAESGETADATVTEASEEEAREFASGSARSDDWEADDQTVEIEAGFIELDSLAPSEVQRFQRELAEERRVPILTATIAIAEACLAAEATPEDRREFGRFLPRLLRQAVAQGEWLEARESLRLLAGTSAEDWSPEGFAQELLQPISVSSLVGRLDAQNEDAGNEFIAFALHLGDSAVDLMNLVLAETQVRRLRRMLAEAIAGLCRDNPERLAPWLADPRWYVVRNTVHILGWIGGSPIAGLLQSAARHPDSRVKQEVVAALGTVEPRLARPLLLRLLENADTKRFCAVLHQLSGARDAAVARLLFAYLTDTQFDARALEERQAIFSALASTAGDELLPDIEAELHKANWFARNAEAHRHAIARVVARIGTAEARFVLERGAQSRRPPVRKACLDALQGMGDEH